MSLRNFFPGAAASGDRRSSKIGTLLALLIIATLLPPALMAQESGIYRLGPRDLIEVKVIEVPEVNSERRVAEDGSISLPLLGDIPVAGLTAEELRDNIETLLTARYVNRANVSVIVKEYAGKPITVLGAVGNPGSLRISGRYLLFQAIAAAGGLSPNAGKDIYVIRTGSNGLSDTLVVSSDVLLGNASAMWNVPIVPSDVINIPPRSTVKIFCLGEVNSPGEIVFNSDDRITLLTLIAKAGGLSERASKGGIRIKRRGPDGKDVEFKVNYGKVMSGDIPDPILQADDIVVVKESFF